MGNLRRNILSLGRLILSGILFILSFQTPVQNSSQQLKPNNTVQEVVMTFIIDPNGGNIYCYQNEKKIYH
jgi:hypothetical protein